MLSKPNLTDLVLRWSCIFEIHINCTVFQRNRTPICHKVVLLVYFLSVYQVTLQGNLLQVTCTCNCSAMLVILSLVTYQDTHIFFARPKLHLVLRYTTYHKSHRYLTYWTVNVINSLMYLGK